MSWKNEIKELEERKKLAKKLGGQDKVERQHKNVQCFYTCFEKALVTRHGLAFEGRKKLVFWFFAFFAKFTQRLETPV